MFSTAIRSQFNKQLSRVVQKSLQGATQATNVGRSAQMPMRALTQISCTKMADQSTHYLTPAITTASREQVASSSLRFGRNPQLDKFSRLSTRQNDLSHKSLSTASETPSLPISTKTPPFFITNFLEDRGRNLRWFLGALVLGASQVVPSLSAFAIDPKEETAISTHREDYEWSEFAHKKLMYVGLASRGLIANELVANALENCLSEYEDNQKWGFSHLHTALMTGSVDAKKVAENLPLTQILDSFEVAQDPSSVCSFAQILEDLSFDARAAPSLIPTLPYLFTMAFTTDSKTKEHIAVTLGNLSKTGAVTELAPMVGALRNLIEHAPTRLAAKHASFSLGNILAAAENNAALKARLEKSLEIAQVDHSVLSAARGASDPHNSIWPHLFFWTSVTSVSALWTPIRLGVHNLVSQKKESIVLNSKVRLPAALLGGVLLTLAMEANKSATNSMIASSSPSRALGLETSSLMLDYASIFIISGLMPFSAAPVLSSYAATALLFSNSQRYYVPNK